MVAKTPGDQQHVDQEWVYTDGQTGVEGVFPPLVDQLSKEVKFDKVQFGYDKEDLPKEGQRPWDRRCVLALRRGIYRVLRINLVREVGRTVVRLRIMKQSDVRRVLVICREHFDTWFNVTPEEGREPSKEDASAGSE